MNKAKKISKEYADRNTCYANDSDLQYRLTRKTVEYGYTQAEKDHLNGRIRVREVLPEERQYHVDGSNYLDKKDRGSESI